MLQSLSLIDIMSASVEISTLFRHEAKNRRFKRFFLIHRYLIPLKLFPFQPFAIESLIGGPFCRNMFDRDSCAAISVTHRTVLHYVSRTSRVPGDPGSQGKACRIASVAKDLPNTYKTLSCIPSNSLVLPSRTNVSAKEQQGKPFFRTQTARSAGIRNSRPSACVLCENPPFRIRGN